MSSSAACHIAEPGGAAAQMMPRLSEYKPEEIGGMTWSFIDSNQPLPCSFLDTLGTAVLRTIEQQEAKVRAHPWVSKRAGCSHAPKGMPCKSQSLHSLPFGQC